MADKPNDTALIDIVRANRRRTVWAKHLHLAERPGGARPETQWISPSPRTETKSIRILQWYIECSILGERLLEKSVDVDPQRRGGRAVLKRTGFTVSQTLVELADSTGVKEVAGNFNLDEKTIVDMLNGLAMVLSKPFAK